MNDPRVRESIARLQQYCARGRISAATPAWGSAYGSVQSHHGSLGAPGRPAPLDFSSTGPAATASGLTNSDSFTLKSSLKQPKSPTGPAAAVAGTGPRDGATALELADQSRENFLSVVAFLRRRYGDDDPSGSLAALTETDVRDLANLFADDLRIAVAKAAGNSSVAIVTTNTDGRAVAAVPGASQATPLQQHSRRSVSNDRDDDEEAAAATSARMPRTLREAMDLLKAGVFCTKYSKRAGKPALRHVRVQFRRALVDGDMVSAPHFCWGVSPADEPSGQMLLLDLKDLATGPSVKMKRNPDGSIVGANGETIGDRQCLALEFASRSVDLAFSSEPECRLWEKALSFVISKNRKLRAGTDE